jgi:hypothetical protein
LYKLMIESIREVEEGLQRFKGCFAYLPNRASIISLHSKYAGLSDENISDVYYLSEQDTENSNTVIEYQLPRETITKELAELQKTTDRKTKTSLPKIITHEQTVYYVSKMGTLFAIDWITQSRILFIIQS